MSMVNMQDADLSGANLKNSALDFADLSEAQNLTQEQIDSAFTGETTRLPDYLLWEEP